MLEGVNSLLSQAENKEARAKEEIMDEKEKSTLWSKQGD